MSVQLILVMAMLSVTKMPVSPNLQAPFVAKIARYDRAYPKKDKPKALVLHRSGEPSSETKQMVKLLGNNGFQVQLVTDSSLSSVKDKVFLVFAMPGVDTQALSAFCKKRKVLSFSGDPEPVREGQLSIALELFTEPGESRTKVRILIHAISLGKEDHQMHSSVVKLSEVIR